MGPNCRFVALTPVNTKSRHVGRRRCAVNCLVGALSRHPVVCRIAADYTPNPYGVRLVVGASSVGETPRHVHRPCAAAVDPSEERVWRTLIRSMVAMPRAIDEDLSRRGPSLSRYGVLTKLSEAPGRAPSEARFGRGCRELAQPVGPDHPAHGGRRAGHPRGRRRRRAGECGGPDRRGAGSVGAGLARAPGRRASPGHRPHRSGRAGRLQPGLRSGCWPPSRRGAPRNGGTR